MCIGILVRLATERASLHHVDETRFHLEVHIPDINVGSGSHVGGRGNGKVTKSLLDHSSGAGGAWVTGSLNRFISRLGERGLPFFKLLKRQDKFQLIDEAEQVLEGLKHHLQSPSILTAPILGEYLLLYITATTHVISTAIVVERYEEGHAFDVQRSVYFVSEILSESKIHYPSIRNLSMLYSSHPESFATTSMSTKYKLSLTFYWRIDSIIGTSLDASPSGQWNWRLST
jgi:hypothetical protein